ncbi:four helix bundle protein [Algoriphagus sp. D3-2-R+10]|uniref:four helix bundle protein n=1 Tax=Algoriphagus aurantiacus TaxID=3103948 RepID=UPI002B3FA07B|nr:four helix bundle protein [Algoriphagus sp. D3-2-R+10]MEB2778568.1 four helix bundle protein [Algoriphagus sp. D3-2-R+10]
MEEYVPHFKFEKLQIWQKAMDFGEDIFSVSKGFHKDELYNLISQSRRAADSIALNIAEGSISQSNPEYKKFMGYAIRSLAEVVTCLHKAVRRKYIDQEQFNTLYAEAFHLMNMMQSFKSKIN